MDCKLVCNFAPPGIRVRLTSLAAGIVNGCKYKVDYYFGVADVSSAMKRVESSKEASWNLVVIDPDGTTEWQEVTLDPPTWYVRTIPLHSTDGRCSP
jgi:hypothetical protein